MTPINFITEVKPKQVVGWSFAIVGAALILSWGSMMTYNAWSSFSKKHQKESTPKVTKKSAKKAKKK